MQRVFKVSTRGFTRCPSCSKHIRLGATIAATACPFCGTSLSAATPRSTLRGRGGLLAAALLSHGAIACESDSASGAQDVSTAGDVIDSELPAPDDTTAPDDTIAADDVLGDTIAIEDIGPIEDTSPEEDTGPMTDTGPTEDLWTDDTGPSVDLWSADAIDEDTGGPDTTDQDIIDLCQTVCCECDYGIPPDPNVYAECCNPPDPEENQ